jgi:hypothetical protein
VIEVIGGLGDTAPVLENASLSLARSTMRYAPSDVLNLKL